ncbi:MAG: tetratricopeptide repeat protein, partial [Planctomycetales bacterium]
RQLSKSADNTAFAIQLLNTAVKLDPNNVVVVVALTNYSRQQDGLGEKAREQMKNMRAQGKASAVVNMILGSDHWEHGEHEKARHHWEQAYQLQPGLTDMANNLAWALIETEPKDPARALELINSALAKKPGYSAYLDTRGHVYIKLEQWREALADLEVVLRTRANYPKLHQSLALIYDQLDDPDMAARHRKQAESNKKQPVKAPALDLRQALPVGIPPPPVPPVETSPK